MAAVMQSAVRMPSPDPGHDSEGPSDGQIMRKRSQNSRSPSPRRDPPSLRHRSRSVSQTRDRRGRDARAPPVPTRALTTEEKQAAAKAEYQKLLTMRSGGTYVPPARLRALQAEIGNDPQSAEFQRMAWEALKKSINGLINKVNVSNIKHIVPELFGENLIRGRGLFCRSIMKAQAASLPFTPIYAAMAAIVNTKLPQVGELLMNRLIVQFRKAYRRNDKSVCLSSITFLAHLINQQVVAVNLAYRIILLLLNKPSDDSVEIAVGLMKEVGQHIEEHQDDGQSTSIATLIWDEFRNILHEADIDKRVQYMIEVLFQIRREGYKDNPSIKEELDLVEEEDQITHQNVDLEGPREVLDTLNIFKFDPQWEEHEQAYQKLKAEILGEASDSEDDDGDDASDSEDEEQDQIQKEVEIKDQSNTDLVNLRRTIYLTIMSSGGFEECTHKLLRINLPAGLEHELPSMLIECASQERTFGKFFGLIGERLCKLNRMWQGLFDEQFTKYYETIHRFETNRLRIIAQFFGHMLSSDAIAWNVMHAIHLNEEETTSSSRIFIKILFEDLSQSMGMKKLQERMADPLLQPHLTAIFPTDNPRNTRFSINFFTAIGMGALTESMREWLKNMPKPVVPALPAAKAASVSSRSSSRSSYSSYSSYSSRSRSPSRSRGRDRARSYSSRGRSDSRSRSRSRSLSPSRSRSRSRLRSAGRARGRRSSYSPVSRRSGGRRDLSASRSRSRSRTPPRRSRPLSYSRSRSGRRRGTSVDHSRSPARSKPAARRRAGTRSRSARSYSASRSRSPPRRSARSGSRSPRRNRRHYSYSPSRSRSRSRSPPRRPRSSSRRRQHGHASSRSPLQPQRRRRRNSSSSRSRSRSRSPPRRGSIRQASSRARNQGRSDRGAAVTEEGTKATRPVVGVAPQQPEQQDDESGIHPSRRGMVHGLRAGSGAGAGAAGGGRGRPGAGDFL